MTIILIIVGSIDGGRALELLICPAGIPVLGNLDALEGT